MEPTKEMDLFEGSGHVEGHSFLDPRIEPLKPARKLGVQQVVRYNSEETGAFTPIENTNTPTTTPETPINKEENPNVFYFYKGDSIYAKGYLSGTVIGEYLSGEKMINPRTQIPIKINGYIAYHSLSDFELWWNGKKRSYLKGETFTANSKVTHKNPPKGK